MGRHDNGIFDKCSGIKGGKQNKKILAILLAAMMLLSLAACGDNDTTDPYKDNPGVSQSGENNNGGEEN